MPTDRRRGSVADSGFRDDQMEHKTDPEGDAKKLPRREARKPVTGVLIGVLFFKYLESITALGQVHELISGAALLWVLSVVPGGLGQVAYSLRDRVLRAVADRRRLLVPSLVADRRVEGTADHAADHLRERPRSAAAAGVE